MAVTDGDLISRLPLLVDVLCIGGGIRGRISEKQQRRQAMHNCENGKTAANRNAPGEPDHSESECSEVRTRFAECESGGTYKEISGLVGNEGEMEDGTHSLK